MHVQDSIIYIEYFICKYKFNQICKKEKKKPQKTNSPKTNQTDFILFFLVYLVKDSAY